MSQKIKLWLLWYFWVSVWYYYFQPLKDFFHPYSSPANKQAYNLACVLTLLPVVFTITYILLESASRLELLHTVLQMKSFSTPYFQSGKIWARPLEVGQYHASLSATSVLCADFSNLRFSWLASPGVEPLCHKLEQGCLGLQYSRCSTPEIESLFHRQMLNREWSLHHSTALAWDLSVARVTYVLGRGGWEMVISCSSWEEKFSDWELGENRVLFS